MSSKPKSKKETPTMQMNVPEGVKQMAEKSVDQAQAAFDKAGEVAHKNVQVLDASASAFKSNAADLQLKVMEIAQNNVNQAFTFARKFIETQEPRQLFEMQQGFVRDQFEQMTKQATELNDIAVKLARETAKPVQETLMQSFQNLGKGPNA